MSAIKADAQSATAGRYAGAIQQINESEREVEDLLWLLSHAARTIRALRASKCFPAGYQSAMPDVVHHFMDAYGWEQEEETRTPPSKADIDLMDKVLDWYYLVNQPRHRAMLFARSLGLSLRKVGKQTGFSHEKVRYFTEHAAHNMLRAIKKDLTRSAVFDSLRAGLERCA